MNRAIVLLFACFAFALGGQAQDSLRVFSFGYLSYEVALEQMRDYTIVKERLATLRSQYEAEMKRVENEFNTKYEEFLEGQREFPKTILLKRQTELQELMTKNIAFKDESLRQLASAEEEMMAPLRERLSEVITQIAEERGYAFVINTDADTCPYINPAMGDDISEEIRRLLVNNR